MQIKNQENKMAAADIAKSLDAEMFFWLKFALIRKIKLISY